MLRRRIHSLAAVAVIAALGTVGASGVAAAKPAAGPVHGHAKPTVKTQLAKRAGGFGGPVIHQVGTTAVAITAFPTGDKGSGTEATCDLWTDQLNADVDELGFATDNDERVAASNQLQEDVDNALDAGCAVIY